MSPAWLRRGIELGVAGSAIVLAACTVETRPSAGIGYTYGGTSSGAAAGSSSGSSSGTMTQPMLVDVDPNRTMTAQPGQGVGIFTEYATGGHWHVWWTCDTSQTNLDCSFDINISTGSGAITLATGEGLSTTDHLLTAGPSGIDVLTQTSTGISGVSFDTPPGAVITLDAKLNGQENGALLFFVQSGNPGDGGPPQPLVNGGYRGELTDPLMLEPSSP
jgi:hypothetical protein